MKPGAGPAAAAQPRPGSRPPGSGPEPGAAPRLVWHLWLRLAHWALASSVLGCLWLHEGGTWHLGLGYLALALALWRTMRGFGRLRRWGDPCAPANERFAQFVHGPQATWDYARALLRGREARHLGHNPLGGWMIVALLGCALLAGISGALYNTDQFWGDATLYRLHQIGGWAFALLVPLHLAGVLLTSVRQRENLVRAMLTGRKRVPQPGDVT